MPYHIKIKVVELLMLCVYYWLMDSIQLLVLWRINHPWTKELKNQQESCWKKLWISVLRNSFVKQRNPQTLGIHLYNVIMKKVRSMLSGNMVIGFVPSKSDIWMHYRQNASMPVLIFWYPFDFVPRCNFLNFSRNAKCLRCNGLNHERLNKLRQEQDHLPLKKGDWICSK